MATVNEKMTALANSIRSKSGVTGQLSLDAMKDAVDSIQVGSGDESTGDKWSSLSKCTISFVHARAGALAYCVGLGTGLQIVSATATGFGFNLTHKLSNVLCDSLVVLFITNVEALIDFSIIEISGTAEVVYSNGTDCIIFKAPSVDGETCTISL